MSLATRVVTAAEEALARQRYVAALDVCVGIGWLHSRNVDQWRQGRVGTVQELLPVPADRLAEVIEHLEQWATGQGLVRNEASYVAATRDRRALRFTDEGDPRTEAAWRTHWVAPGLSAAQEQKIAKKQSAAPDLVVIQPSTEFTCAECGEVGSDLLMMEDAGPLCLACADMDHLVFLPAGDAALTRRSKNASKLSAVVVRWNKSRKRYERQGLLVSQEALEQAEQECLADADVRLRRRERDAVRREHQDVEFTGRFAAEIARLYPGCPPSRAGVIAAHAGLRGSGRVGRSAAGRNLDEQAVRLAVIASVRHLDTDYDELLMTGVARADARERIRPVIDEVLACWKSSGGVTRTNPIMEA
jgi:hypothetical protein